MSVTTQEKTALITEQRDLWSEQKGETKKRNDEKRSDFKSTYQSFFEVILT